MLALYGLTLFVSAFLLFLVQPLFTRLALPLLGGAPAVWNTSLMFFQTLLLAGYLYVHLGVRWLGVRRHLPVHLALVGLSLAALPIGIPEGWTPPVAGSPIPWLLATLLVGLGAPFFLLSASAPLLQAWFARLGHPSAPRPYPLYAVSNAGSLLALLSYPFVVEPSVGVAGQVRMWGLGYVALAILLAACGGLLWRHGRRGSERAAMAAPDGEPACSGAPGHPSEGGDAPEGGGWTEGAGIWGGGAVSRSPARARLIWTMLALVPSSLLLGVTTHLSTDVASVPLLWVMPLALYLLTFVWTFSGAPRPGGLAGVQVGLVTAVALMVFWGVEGPLWLGFLLHLLTFFVSALVLHGHLVDRRPHPSRLTDFYVWVSLGGALGGIFNAVVAPLLFDTVAEYAWMLVAGVALGVGVGSGGRRGRGRREQEVGPEGTPSVSGRPPASAGAAGRVRRLALPLGPAAALWAAVRYELIPVADLGWWRFWALTGLAGLLVLGLRRSAAAVGVALGAVFLAGAMVADRGTDVLLTHRDFFGTVRVVHDPLPGARLLYHGTTVHGAQFDDRARRLEPITYYHPRGPVGDVFTAYGDRWAEAEMGVVGLGTGNLMCHGRAGQIWTFYEIDPAVEAMARDSTLFTYLADCPPEARVVLGDARLTLAREPEGRFDLLVIDAFSSDAIPVHLLTREAFAVYDRVLAPRGLLLLHISNRYLDLEPVLTAAVPAVGFRAVIREHRASEEASDRTLEYSSDWVLMARSSDDLAPVRSRPGWRLLMGRPGVRLWTDDYVDVVGALDR